MRVRPLRRDDAPACDAIIASLPDWFGDENGIQECAAAVRAEPGFVASVDDVVVAFLTVARPRDLVVEISWMAVRPDHRGGGHGRALVDALVQTLHDDGTRFLAVKTLSDRDPSPPYAQTRAFYEAMGFTPLMDLDIWGPENPALLYVRSVARPPRGAAVPTVDDLLSAARAGGERVTAQQARDELERGAIVVDQRTLEQRREHRRHPRRGHHVDDGRAVAARPSEPLEDPGDRGPRHACDRSVPGGVLVEPVRGVAPRPRDAERRRRGGRVRCLA